MPYFIDTECIGCTICAKKCPVECISGDVKKLHIIDAPICIDCGVCESYCPVDCIMDPNGVKRPKIPAKQRPIAVVEESLCTACEFCIGACPFNCLEMVDASDGGHFKIAANVRAKDCVGCKLCEEVCVQKGAITILWPDGRYCEELGVPTVLSQPYYQA